MKKKNLRKVCSHFEPLGFYLEENSKHEVSFIKAYSDLINYQIVLLTETELKCQVILKIRVIDPILNPEKGYLEPFWCTLSDFIESRNGEYKGVGLQGRINELDIDSFVETLKSFTNDIMNFFSSCNSLEKIMHILSLPPEINSVHQFNLPNRFKYLFIFQYHFYGGVNTKMYEEAKHFFIQDGAGEIFENLVKEVETFRS